jgi:hypothetical protein
VAVRLHKQTATPSSLGWIAHHQMKQDNICSTRYKTDLYILRTGMEIFQLHVPESLQVSVMSEVHNILTESAHGGHAKTYNRITSTYYWLRISRDIKRNVCTCDICQKSKPKCHALFGLLQPIPIPTQPFEVVSMDFILELPLSDGFDNIFVIVDKLTKYAIFIPTTTTIGEKETAELFFHHVISKFGIPRQVISDRTLGG